MKLLDKLFGRGPAAATEPAPSPPTAAPGLRSSCSREEYLRMSSQERAAFAAEFLAMLEIQHPTTEFNYFSFPELRYDEMVFSSVFSDLLHTGRIHSAGRERFRLAPTVPRTSTKKTVRPTYPDYMLPTIPPQGRSFEVDEDCYLVPVGEYLCPMCHENLGDLVPSQGPNVVIRFHRAHGVDFWWAIVSHCGRKLLISNTGM